MRGATVSGLVLDPDGNGVAGAFVVVEVAGGWDERRHVFTGESALDMWRGQLVIADEPGTYRMIVRTESIIVLRVLKVEDPKLEWSERIELGELTGTIDWSELPDPTMLVWIAGEGNSLTAARLQPDDLGDFTATVPVGEGHVHHATPEMMEDVAPPDWPVLGRAVVKAGETTTFSGE